MSGGADVYSDGCFIVGHCVLFICDNNRMQFKPESELVFSYERGKHLPTTLTIKNVGSLQMVFKVQIG